MLANLSVAAMNLIVLQGQWDLRTMWSNMSIIAKAVVGILFLLSAWSLGVMIDRVLMYSAARKQSRVFVQQVAGALREGKLDEAISIAERNKKSHIAKVVATGLSAVAGGISEALVTTALGLLVAVPAVWAYNYFTNKVEAFDVEMDNSSMELVNYFITRRAGGKK